MCGVGYFITLYCLVLALVRGPAVHQNTWDYVYHEHKGEGERIFMLGSHSEERFSDNLSIACWPLALKGTIIFQHHHTEAQESKI